MATLELTGKIYKVFETVTVKDSFKKREFVIETDENYPQKIKLELTQDKCALLDRFQVGSDVTVGFNVRGNEWEGKFFNTLQAWKINAKGATAGGGNSSNEIPSYSGQDGGDQDDLPF